MPHYLVLDPEVLKRSIVWEGDTSDEEAAVETVPGTIPLPKTVVVMDVELLMGNWRRFVVDDVTDKALPETVERIKRPDSTVVTP
jgi:hypothetical protein